MGTDFQPKEADRHRGIAVYARLEAKLFRLLKAEATEQRRSIGAQLSVILAAHYDAKKNGAKS